LREIVEVFLVPPFKVQRSKYGAGTLNRTLNFELFNNELKPQLPGDRCA
jgi:hypothetical protein